MEIHDTLKRLESDVCTPTIYCQHDRGIARDKEQGLGGERDPAPDTSIGGYGLSTATCGIELLKEIRGEGLPSALSIFRPSRVELQSTAINIEMLEAQLT